MDKREIVGDIVVGGLPFWGWPGFYRADETTHASGLTFLSLHIYVQHWIMKSGQLLQE